MQDRTQQIVQRMIEAGESEQDIAAVIQQLKVKPKTREEQFDEATAPIHRLMRGDPAAMPKTIPDMLATGVSLLPQSKFLGAAKGIATHGPRIVSNLVQRFPRMANAVIRAGGAAGAGGVGSLMRSGMDETPELMGDVATNAALEMGKQGGLELLGPAIEHGGRGLAHWGMNRALSPSKAANLKYGNEPSGDLPQQLLDRNLRVSSTSADKAQAAREAAQAEKATEIERLAETTVPTQPIRAAAAAKTGEAAEGEALLAGKFTGRQPTRTISNFAKRRQPTPPTPSGLVDSSGRPFPAKALEPTPDVITIPETEYALKRLNLKTDAARRQIAGPLARVPKLQDAERIALSKELRLAQDSVSPVFKKANQEIRASFGVENAIRQRLAMPGTGLADETVMFGSAVNPAIPLLRIVREPQMLSAISLLVNQLSKGGKVAPAAVRGLMVASHGNDRDR